AERRLHFSESRTGPRHGARWPSVVGRRAGRSRGAEGRRCRRRSRISDPRQFHRQRRCGDCRRDQAADRSLPLVGARSVRRGAARRDRLSRGLLMSTLLIEGGQRLSGAVAVEGNKNAALPLLAACLLTKDECVLTNVPRISDVEVMARLILDLGGEVEGIGSTTLRLRCPDLVKDEPDAALVGRLRGSVLLLGPLLARRGRAHLAPPGGDFPARRTIATHLEALESMGARQMPGAGHVLDAPGGLKPTSIYLYEASVTGTETALLAA